MCATCERDAENAYFAGFFDGEGTVLIREAKRNNGKTKETYLALTVHVSIANLEAAPLARGQERWGGRLYVEMNPRRTKPIHRLHLHGRHAFAFLSDIFPYLMVKQQQAAFAMELQERIDAIKDRLRRSDEEMSERYRLRDAIKALNARRYYGPPSRLRAIGGGCATCGCLQPENKHGDDRNVTVSELRTSATRTRVSPKSMPVAMRNVRRTLKVARRK